MTRTRIAFHLLVLTALLTLFLICWGGLVKSTGSSLGCPDWPLCHGQLIPDTSYMSPSQQMEVFWEYGHRVIGAALGLCAIAIVLLLWRRDAQGRSLRGGAGLLLGLIVFQGLLGATTVLMDINAIVSTVHLAMSMLVLMTILALAQACWWRGEGAGAAPRWLCGDARAVRPWVETALIAVYLQIVLGALVRHLGATWAAGSGPTAALFGVDPQTRAAMIFSSDPMAMLNLTHRYVAFGVAGLVMVSALMAWARLGSRSSAGGIVVIVLPVTLVLFQVVVGIGMIAMQFHLAMRTAHLGVGALLLAAQFLLVGAVRRAAAEGPAAAPEPPAPSHPQPMVAD